MPCFAARPRRLPGVTSAFRPVRPIPAFIDSALVPARATLPDAAATRRMADDMREHGAREGGITRDGLALLGWSAAQIDRVAPAARERAQALSGASL